MSSISIPLFRYRHIAHVYDSGEFVVEDRPLRYSMLIQWSCADNAFLVTLPEWENRVINPVTHGDTYEEAVANGRLALEDLIVVSQERGQPLPAPQFLDLVA